MIRTFHTNLEKVKMINANDEKKIACYSFSSRGIKIGNLLEDSFSFDSKIKFKHVTNSEIIGGIKTLVPTDFASCDGLIFISSTGIAVRMIKDLIKDKTRDPAVLVIDDSGKFVIPILSGHIGGANELAKNIATIIEGQAVITTASDSRGFEAVDLFAQRCNYAIASMVDAKKVTAQMLNSAPILFCIDKMDQSINFKTLIKYPNIVLLNLNFDIQDDDIENLKTNLDKIVAIIFITENIECNFSNIVTKKKLSYFDKTSFNCLNSLPSVKLIPRTLNIGIGLRRGVEYNIVRQAVEQALNKINKNIYSINKIGSIDIKKNEQGLIDFTNKLNRPLFFFSKDDIEKIENNFEKSEFVKKTIGVYNVSAPVAFLLGGSIILDKFKYDGVTVSVSSI